MQFFRHFIFFVDLHQWNYTLRTQNAHTHSQDASYGINGVVRSVVYTSQHMDIMDTFVLFVNDISSQINSLARFLHSASRRAISLFFFLNVCFQLMHKIAFIVIHHIIFMVFSEKCTWIRITMWSQTTSERIDMTMMMTMMKNRHIIFWIYTLPSMCSSSRKLCCFEPLVLVYGCLCFLFRS